MPPGFPHFLPCGLRSTNCQGDIYFLPVCMSTALEFQAFSLCIFLFFTEIFVLCTLISQCMWELIQNVYLCCLCCVIYPDCKYIIRNYADVIYLLLRLLFSHQYPVNYLPLAFVFEMIRRSIDSIS